MMDGRFDRHFAELLVHSLADKDGEDGLFVLWPLAAAAILGLVVFACAAVSG